MAGTWARARFFCRGSKSLLYCKGASGHDNDIRFGHCQGVEFSDQKVALIHLLVFEFKDVTYVYTAEWFEQEAIGVVPWHLGS